MSRRCALARSRDTSTSTRRAASREPPTPSGSKVSRRSRCPGVLNSWTKNAHSVGVSGMTWPAGPASVPVWTSTRQPDAPRRPRRHTGRSSASHSPRRHAGLRAGIRPASSASTCSSGVAPRPCQISTEAGALSAQRGEPLRHVRPVACNTTASTTGHAARRAAPPSNRMRRPPNGTAPGPRRDRPRDRAPEPRCCLVDACGFPFRLSLK